MGAVLPNEEREPQIAAPERSFAYCSDTAYNPALIPLLKGVDSALPRSYFPGRVSRRRRLYTGHTTARQAAELALAAGVKQLGAGTFFHALRSDLSPLLAEAAQATFPGDEPGEVRARSLKFRCEVGRFDVLMYSSAQVLRCSGAQVCKCSSIHVLKCSSAQVLRCSECSCAQVLMCSCVHVRMC
jgi:hypothetical protein